MPHLDTILAWMWRLGVVSAAIVAVAGGLLYAQQEKLLYLPSVKGIPRHNRDNPEGYRSPSERGLKHWFSVHIPTSDGTTIHAWYILHPTVVAETLLKKKKNKKVPTLIFFHGNAGNIGLRLPNIQYMMHYLGAVNVLLVDYRGYGDSDDTFPTECGLQLDGQAAYQWIVSAATTSNPNTSTATASNDDLEQLTPAAFIDTSQLYIFGRSLGGAVAFQLASYLEKQQSSSLPLPAGLLIENTFLNISAMVDRIFPMLKPLKPFVLRMHWDSHQAATNVKQIPILYLAGARDDLVPHHHMQVLYQTSVLAGNQNVQLHVVANGTHNETWMQGGARYWKAIRAFLAKTGAHVKKDDDDAVAVDGEEANVIPTMSQKVMDMAKQAFQSSSNSAASTKPKQS